MTDDKLMTTLFDMFGEEDTWEADWSLTLELNRAPTYVEFYAELARRRGPGADALRRTEMKRHARASLEATFNILTATGMHIEDTWEFLDGALRDIAVERGMTWDFLNDE